MTTADDCIADRAVVEATLASRVRLLRFPRALERRFEADVSRERCRRMVVLGLMGLVLYDIFLVADWHITPDVFAIALVLRLAVVTPLILALAVVVWYRPPVWLRESIATATIGIVSGTAFMLMLLSQAPYRSTQHHAMILVVLFATIVLRLRFPYAVAACLICLLAQAATLSVMPEYPHSLWVSTNLNLAGTVVLALATAYTLERDARLMYLTGLRGRMLNDELSELSLHDPLTGLSNRRALDTMLVGMDGEPPKRVGRIAVVILDIDHFKLYNDNVGHQGGDTCLKRIAELLRARLGQGGELYRFGGEEFLAVLPATELPEAVVAAEALRRAVEAAAIPHPGLPLGMGVVTVSGGVAAAEVGGNVTAAEIIAGADAALYAAKRNGRNQVWPPFLGVQRGEVVDLSGRQAAS